MQPRFLKISLLALITSIFIDSIGWGVVFPVFTQLIINNTTGIFTPTVTYATRSMWFEILIGCYCFAMFLSSPILGNASDRVGRKKVIVVSLLGALIGFLVCALGAQQKSVGLLLAGRLLAGFTAGNFSVAQAAIIDMSTKAQLTRRISLFLLANSIGFALGPTLGVFFLHGSHHVNGTAALPFLLVALLFGISMILVMLGLQETHSPTLDTPINWLSSFSQMKDGLKNKHINLYFAVFLLFMLGYSLFFCTLPVYVMAQFQQGAAGSGLLMSYFALMTLVGLYLLLPQLKKHTRSVSILLISVIITFITYCAFPFITHWPLFWVIITVTAMVEPMFYVTCVTLISSAAAGDEQGKIMGIVGSLGALSWGLGPLLSGALVHASPSTPLWVSAAFVLVAGLCAIKPIQLARQSNADE